MIFATEKSVSESLLRQKSYFQRQIFLSLKPSFLVVFQGIMGSQCVSVLLDTGSTHNFIQSRIARAVGLPIIKTSTFQVMIGNGQKLECQGHCTNVKLSIQNFTFSTTFHVLPIQGADVVLGVQWLKELGPVTIDYNQLSMTFEHKGMLVRLTGNTTQISQVSHHQLRQMLKVDAVATCFHLKAQHVDMTS